MPRASRRRKWPVRLELLGPLLSLRSIAKAGPSGLIGRIAMKELVVISLGQRKKEGRWQSIFVA